MSKSGLRKWVAEVQENLDLSCETDLAFRDALVALLDIAEMDAGSAECCAADKAGECIERIAERFGLDL